MKKQMTILAAAALVASFATAAFAAAPATNISMSGHLDYAVEYHVVDSTLAEDFWTDNADNGILDSALSINWATAGNPNLGTISYNVLGNGTTLGTGTIVGTFGATTVKLGTVGHSWDSLSNGSLAGASFGNSNPTGDGTSYPGAEIIGSLGKMSYDVITEKVDDTVRHDTVGLRVAGPLGSVNAYGGIVVDAEKAGLLHVGGTTKLGTADVAVQYAKEIGLDGGHGFLATASMPVSPALTVVGKVSKVNDELYDGFIMKDSDLGAWDLLGNMANAARFPGYCQDVANFYGKATYAWSPSGTGYASVDAPGGVGANATFTVGTSFSPMFITDANVATSNGVSTFTVNMSKTLTNGATLAAGAAYKTAATPVSGAYAKVSKKFDWLTVWGGLRKNWATDWSGFNDTTGFVAAAGASASVAF